MRSLDFDGLAERLRNWGRWGADDQRGTLNHIDPAALVRAASEVQEGKAIRLGLNFDKDGPQMTGKRFNPQLYVTALFGGPNGVSPEMYYADDVIHMPLQAATQWDALSHVHYDGHLYNGCKVHETLTVSEGAKRLGAEHLASPGIVSRGILLDVARMKNVDMLPVDYTITPDDLREACHRQGVSPLSGDIVLVRTGHMRRFTKLNDRLLLSQFPQPGLSHRCTEWLYDCNVAAVGADNLAVEYLTVEMLQEGYMPFHMIALRDMGMPLGELFDLEALSQDCLGDGRYSFMLVAPALPVTGAFGSPINPLALK